MTTLFHCRSEMETNKKSCNRLFWVLDVQIKDINGCPKVTYLIINVT